MTVGGVQLTEERFEAWDLVTWESFARIQNVFTGVLDCYEDSTLKKTTALLKGLSDVDVYD